ncbi:EAL domain-containing protein [Halomonas mongoliensis]|uniref:EAL domain-containing protein n=1 Tax=Halomonas mongoliensis TaxID=321265 RepID=UPI00403AB511
MESMIALLADLPTAMWLVLAALPLVVLLIGLLLHELCQLNRVQLVNAGDEEPASGTEQADTASALFTPRELQLKQELTSALADTTRPPFFDLHVQPIYRLSDGRLLGGEALIRWRHPELGQISPGEFIPVAEMTGQILQLDRRVLAEVVARLAEVPKALLGTLRISVNVSIQHFYNVALVHHLQALCHEHDVPMSCLELEVTEHASCDDLELIQGSMRLVRSHGMGLALDDFGTGYTSLRFLQELPFSKVKLDRSFVCRIDHEQQSRRLVACLVEMSHTLEMTCVAEGIEMAGELELLQRMGCDAGQGYLLGRPVPCAEFIDLAERSLLIGGQPIGDRLGVIRRRHHGADVTNPATRVAESAEDS